MGYNRFRWWTNSRYRTRPLKQTAPLLLKIRNGDFEYSPYFREAQDNEDLYQEMYKDFIETSLIKSEFHLHVEAHQYAKMKRIKARKLLEEADLEEYKRLRRLRDSLSREFGKDLWDDIFPEFDGTTEDLYHTYKKRLGLKHGPSEIAIKLGRKTTKGLLP